MIEEKRLNCWAEFKHVVADIRGSYGYRKWNCRRAAKYKRKNTVLFRGQSNAS